MLIDEVEDLGGMTKAIQAGVPKLRVEESAAIRQARVDKKEDVITLVMALQHQNFVLGNSITNLVNHWPHENHLFVHTSQGIPFKIQT